MAPISDRSRRAWALAGRQDDVIAWEQLRELGFSADAVRHRLRTGRLHRHWPGVYAVGRKQLTRRGEWRAALLACGRGASLSHWSAGALCGYLPDDASLIHVSVVGDARRRLPGIRCHRRSTLAAGELCDVDGIPATGPSTTLVDIACELSDAALERAVNAADKLDLIDPESLRAEVLRLPPRPGRGRLLSMLDRCMFVTTDSELERMLVPIIRRAGLGDPLTGVMVNGFKVDFYWPDLGLIVETDGLRYHRTPAQQARDRLRDQTHTAAGLTPLRFTHGQIRYEPRRVEATLRTVRRRLQRRSDS